MKTVIMAGGRGTRISELFPNLPKPLIPIESSDGTKKPVLQWEIESLKSQGFVDIILTVSYMADLIEDYFGDGSKFGCKIQYYREDIPIGNAGALFKIKEMLGDDPFLLLNADSVFDVDFNRMVNFHNSKKAEVTIFTHPNSHPFDSGLVFASEDGKVEAWLTKEDKRPNYYKNRVNAGLHVVNPSVLELSNIDVSLIGSIDKSTGQVIKVDLDRQILKPLCNTNRMYCYDSPEYVKDMGTPDRYKTVSKDFQEGIVQSKNLKNKQKAVFLDRDGTLNRYVGFLKDTNEFELLPGVADAIKVINSSGYLAIVVTNQPVIARGEVTYEQLQEIHNKMETLLGAEGAYLDAIYFCPHHPHRGYEGEVSELKIECECRKPKPGMLLKAARDYNIDLNQSWMVGDGENDIKAGKAAGCKTALVGKEDYMQDLKVSSLIDFVKYLN